MWSRMCIKMDQRVSCNPVFKAWSYEFSPLPFLLFKNRHQKHGTDLTVKPKDTLQSYGRPSLKHIWLYHQRRRQSVVERIDHNNISWNLSWQMVFVCVCVFLNKLLMELKARKPLQQMWRIRNLMKYWPIKINVFLIKIHLLLKSKSEFAPQ